MPGAGDHAIRIHAMQRDQAVAAAVNVIDGHRQFGHS